MCKLYCVQLGQHKHIVCLFCEKLLNMDLDMASHVIQWKKLPLYFSLCPSVLVVICVFFTTVSLYMSVRVMKCARVTDCIQTSVDTYILCTVKKERKKKNNNKKPASLLFTGSYCSLIKPTDFRVKISLAVLTILRIWLSLNHN